METVLQTKAGKLSRIKAGVIAFTSACLIAAMLPMTAMAAITSPEGVTATGANNVTLHINATVASNAGSGNLIIDATDQLASNVPAGQNTMASFHVYTSGNLKAEDLSDINLTFNVGRQYAGSTATVYVQHNDGTTEILTAVVAADGSVSVIIDRLSIFSISVDAGTATSNAATVAPNKSATSPQTGIDTNALAFATIACAVAGCGVAVALRRRGENG